MQNAASLSDEDPRKRGAAFRDYADNVREAEVSFLLTGRGKAVWSVQRCCIGKTVLQFAEVGAGTITDGVTAQADRLLFVMQTTAAPHAAYLHGERVAPYGIAVLAPGSKFVFTNQHHHQWLSISVGSDQLSSMAQDWLGERITRRAATLIAAAEESFSALVRTATRAAHSDLARNSDQFSSGPPDDTENAFLGALDLALTSSARSRFTPAQSDGHYYNAIVRRALAEVATDEIALVGDLCRAIGVNERTLQRAFNAIFRMPPQRYLKLRKLNQIHAALCASTARGALVTDILTRYGITEMGRFATEYRVLFGERPSQTLRWHNRGRADALQRI